MSQIEAMLEAHPWETRVERGLLAQGIGECFNCAQVCAACADACLGEGNMTELIRGIRLCLDCADVCLTTGRVLSRLTQADMALMSSQIQACESACQVCQAECRRHAAHHAHCRMCADACQRCGRVCGDLLIALPRIAVA